MFIGRFQRFFLRKKSATPIAQRLQSAKLARLQMVERAGKRIGRIGGRTTLEQQEALDHELHLSLSGTTMAGDRLLDLQGCVFMNGQFVQGKGRDRCAACLPQQEGGARVDIHKDFFDRCFIGLIGPDELVNTLNNPPKPLSGRSLTGVDRAARNPALLA